ncbi:MAG: HAD-IC family P-type ATPase [Coriobacteriaceae bacterium]|nr:HAD-IC family P-type ATPase [Coriobacteriaceae bacterium]
MRGGALAFSDNYTGLSGAEVAKRKAQGKSNVDTDVKTKTIAQIISEHTLTFFNGINLVIALLVLATGYFRNLLFVTTPLINLFIGVIQEIRAKRQVDRLQLLTASEVRVRRDGKDQLISSSELVLDDVIVLAHGQQVPADSLVLAGSATMNESLLTGESEPVSKHVGDAILSGSFVDSGSLVCRINKVGKDGYAAHINAEAKYVKPIRSEIKSVVESVVRLGSYMLIPLGIALFIRTSMTGAELNHAILTSVSAVIAMIPQGLVLLTSTVLAVATTRLGQRQVLVQQAYCIETLARVDTLCLDKTGTLTTGGMIVDQVVGADGGKQLRQQTLTALSTIAHAGKDDANETATAILNFVKTQKVAPRDVVRTVPFSSQRKYSGCICLDGQALVMGAAQFVLGDECSSVEAQLRSFGELARVLIVARVEDFDKNGVFVGKPQLLGFVSIQDELRASAQETMEYFTQQGVNLRVISGDDPVTVSAIARMAGVPQADKWIDTSTLTDITAIAQAVRDYRVFGRVTPEIKRELVIALKNQGHTVAMTGDGVNDILALREADCSVAMASGSAAARNVAEVVLADDDFAHMPEVVAEGRRSINNLQRSASLFLVKTVYAAVLAFICVFLPPYPFIPIQASLLSGIVIGLPSLVLALEPNHELVTGSFLEHVLSRSLPASLAIVVALFAEILAGRALGWSFGLVSTACTYLVAIIGIILVWRISLPLNALRKALLGVMICSLLIATLFFFEFFSIEDLSLGGYIFCAIVALLSVGIFKHSYDWLSGPALDAGFLKGAVARVEALNVGRDKRRAAWQEALRD